MESPRAAGARHGRSVETARFSAGDVIAGLSVALILIPQSLAYATVAGLPAYHGLYASILPTVAAAFFASSPYLQTGPGAMTSLLTFGALSALAPAQSPAYVALAALLALVVGIIRISIGLVGAGWVAYLMSQPVLTAFTAAAALLIAASQLPTALGVTAPPGALLAGAWHAATHPGDWELASVLLSLVTVVLVLGGRRLHALFPGVLVAVVMGVGFSLAVGYDGYVLGDIPGRLPPLSVALPWESTHLLLVPGMVIALVGFAEPSAIARGFAAQDRKPWSPTREFISQGVANLASGISAGFPVGGSFARSAVCRLAGARTRWSGAVTGLAVLAFMPLSGTLAPLPRAILGAIVISGVAKLLDVRPLLVMFRYSKAQASVALVTFALTLLLSPRIDLAVIAGVGLSVMVHVWRELRVQVGTQVEGATLRLQPAGVLFFASAPGLEKALIDQLAAYPHAQRVVIDLKLLGRIDYNGAIVIRGVCQEAKEAGLDVHIVGVPPQAEGLVRRVLGEDCKFGE